MTIFPNLNKFCLMPRSARIDIPGILQHVMVRGNEQRDIFLDDHDRESFVRRLSFLLNATGTSCFAWAILSNHCHLLLMPTDAPLSTIMRRLLTGHAVFFNRKYNRSGHLFQNRYKSIVCEEESYLLELVRYIHLNPLRAGLVADLAELDRYPWSGHAALMGRQPLENQEIDAILARFGGSIPLARQRYRVFVADGIPAGRRDDLVGGGRRRNESGKSEEGEDIVFDGRILGNALFVNSLQKDQGLRDRMKPVPLPELLETIGEILRLDPEDVRRPCKVRDLAAARGVFCCLAVREMGYKGIEVGRYLNLGPTGVTLATRRGDQLLKKNPSLKERLVSSILEK